MDEALREALLDRHDPRVVVLTGAGISAESGIPTFRGKEGYWTVGSREYHPQEMATHAAFEDMPKEVWRWYLYRRGVCRGADPNPGHLALAQLEQALGDRFSLITQNVDGLHLRAGNTLDRTMQVHGNIDYMRCTARCGVGLVPIDDGVPRPGREDPLSDEDFGALVCPRCGAPARPHVLWFDEYYDESLYRSNTAMLRASKADVFIVIGSSGAASLPMHATAEAARVGALIIDINPGQNPFADFARGRADGFAIQTGAGEGLPPIVELLAGAET